MLDFIVSHPLYIPFIILNIYIIYKVIKMVLINDQEKNDEDDNGGISDDNNPILDLPPGVELPAREPSLIV
ncbi:hypothetical protein [Algoriphagus sp.]|uniref:hypothetical protein n=1 Tax=Algoriphagus sp. TaxID=1872435 RepID=UPI0039188F8A